MSSDSVINTDFVELRNIANDASKQASEYILQENGNKALQNNKSSSTDYVTEADRQAEALIVSIIKSARPQDGFLGEEGASEKGRSNVQWVIDPIDGTTNYIYDHSGFGPSIAAKVGDEVVAGAVTDSSRGEVFDAAKGHGARCNGESITLEKSTTLETALVATGFSYRDTDRITQAEILLSIIPQIADIRRMGSAAIDLCSVAKGRVDAFFETGLNEWDFAAGMLIASEAGATTVLVSDFTGKSLTLAVNPSIEEQFRTLLYSAALSVKS
ncbi:MAG: inositol monophosphatase [Acidimicrobiaceae bacterium]|nr:inositol monophosphatase [Acidimicrobiaceae bacterium]|tara:strand:- start:82 stop:894 length:813 start_codon:yes stop_codon:yes gene_type:complete